MLCTLNVHRATQLKETDYPQKLRQWRENTSLAANWRACRDQSLSKICNTDDSIAIKIETFEPEFGLASVNSLFEYPHLKFWERPAGFESSATATEIAT